MQMGISIIKIKNMKNKASKIILTVVFAGILVFGASFAKATTNEDMIKILQSLIQVLQQMIVQLQTQLAQRNTTTTTILDTSSSVKSSISPPTTLISPGNTITINRAITLQVIQDSPDKKMVLAIDSNLQNLYRIIITPQTKLKIGSITDGGDWLNIGLPKINAEPKTWYDLRWNHFPTLDCLNHAIIKVKGIIRSDICYINIDADTVYFYSLNIDPGCPIGQ